MGGEEEGEESREESSGGNCEEKVDGEHSVGEIGENACGWALTYSFSGPLGIVSLSPVSPTLHHPALWWSKVPKKGAAVPPRFAIKVSIGRCRDSVLLCAKLLMYSRSSYRAILRFRHRRFSFSSFFFLRIPSGDWSCVLHWSCHGRSIHSRYFVSISPQCQMFRITLGGERERDLRFFDAFLDSINI